MKQSFTHRILVAIRLCILLALFAGTNACTEDEKCKTCTNKDTGVTAEFCDEELDALADLPGDYECK
jgi:hypothetical protein